MASGVDVELPESILNQTREEENDAKIQQCQRITEVNDTIHETEKDEQQEKDLKVSKGDHENTDGESFLYPPTVEKAANCEDIEKMSKMSEEVKYETAVKPSLYVEARETSNEEPSLVERFLSEIESETILKEDIPQIGISKDDSIESDGKEITGILDRDVISRDGNESEEKEKEIREPREHDNEEAYQVSQSTENIDLEMIENYDKKSAEIKISDKFADVSASESDLQKRREADNLGTGDEKEELIENAPTEIDSSQQTGVQTIDQSLPRSNPEVIESIHNVDEEQCSEEKFETRDIPIEKNEEHERSTLPESSILEQSNGNHSLDETLDTSIQESDLSQVEENGTEPTSSLVDGKTDESEESEVISEENHIEADAKEITGILDGDLPKNENDSSLGNDSAENEDENHDARSEIEQIEQDKQGSVVLSEESIHNEDAPQVSKDTEFTPLEGSAKEEPDVNDTDLEMIEKYDEKSADILELEPEINISDKFADVSASKSDLQKRREADSDEKEELIENAPTEIDSSQQTGVQTIDQSLPRSTPEVIESIHNVDEEQCSEESIETRDTPIEKNEEQKRSTSPETSILEQSNGNHSLDDTLETSIQESDLSQVEENATEPTSSLVDGKTDESEESEVIREKNHIEADAKEITGILDGDLPKNENDSSLGNDSAENEDENHDARSEIEQIEQDEQGSVVLSEESIHNEDAPQVSKDTEFTPLEGSAKEEPDVNDTDLEMIEKHEEKSADILELEPEINISDEFAEVSASVSDLQKRREADSDEKEELIENAPTELDSPQQTGVQTINQSLLGSNPEVIESIHNVDEEQCSEEKFDTRDIPIEKNEEHERSTLPESSILEQSNGNHSLDKTLDTSIQDSDVSQAEEKATELTSSLVDGKIDESEEGEVISEENHVEADAKDITGILDGDPPKNENDSSLGNDSAENEDENHDTKSEIEQIEQDKQENMVLLEESIHNEEGPQVSKDTEFTHLEGSAKEEAKVNDINLETGKTEEEKSAASLESESEKIQETDMEMNAPQNEPASDEKDVPAEVETTQQTGVETFEESLPRSNTEVNESIDNDDKEHCTEEKIESRDFPIENIEELKRCTSLETGKFEQRNKNLSLDETLGSVTQKSEASQLEENAAESTSTSAEKIDEWEESEVTRDENHDLTPNATIEEDSKAHHTEESLSDSHPITESAKNVEEEPTEVENEEAQPAEQEATVENIESRNFPIEKTEELERSNAPETTMLEQSNEKMSLEETLDSSKESDMSSIKENATIDDTTFPVAEEIDDTQNLKAEVNSSTKSIETEGEADLPGKEREDVIQDATEVEDMESQTVIEQEIIEDEEKTNGVDEDSSQQHDDKKTAESDIGENLVTDTAKDAEMVDREFEERNMESSIENQEDIEASQDHSEKTNTSNDEVQLVDSDNFTDAITTRENPEPVDVVEELDAKSGAAYDDSLASEQEAKPNEHPHSEENSEGQAQSIPAEDPIYKSEDANQEATEVENQETNIVREEAKGGDFQDVFEREIADDEVKTNEADEKSSQQHNENAIKSDIAETEDDGDKAHNEIHGTDIVEKERMVDCGFEESNSGNSITNDDADIEVVQSQKKNTNVSNDEVQLLELKEAETDKQLENVEDEDSNTITDGTAAKENPEPVDAVEKLETVTKLEAIDDHCDASDEANKSVTEGSSTIAEYENEKSANQELSVVVIEDEMNDKEVQLNGETQSQREEAIGKDQQEVASDEEESKAANEQSETEESQQKDNAGEEESVEHTFEENISNNEEINPENAEVSPSQDEYTEIFEEANQVIKIEEVAAFRAQEENLEQEDPTSIIDNVSEEEEATVVENKETQIVKEEAKDEVCHHVVEREIADDEMKANEVDEKLSQPNNENAIESDINETQEDGDEAYKIHVTDIVEKEKIIDREFEESNSGKSIGNEEATIEASQSHEENINVSNVDQLLEPQEGAKIEKQLEDVENEDSNSITDGISAKENPEPAEAVEKLVNEESSTVEAYEKVKSATHLSTNQDFTVVGMENELNDKEVQLSGETQSLGEEAINRDLQEVASNEEKLKVSNEQSETEESQLKDNAREEESVDPRFEENISNNEEINSEIIEVTPSQDVYTEIPDDTNQVTDVQEETALKEQEDNLEQDNPTNINDNVSAEEENFEDPSVDLPKQLDERTSTESENIEAESDEEVHESGRFNQTRELDTIKGEDKVKQEEKSDNTIGNEETIEPSHGENANISTDVIQVINVHGEAKNLEQEEKIENENPSIVVDSVSLEENPKQAEDIDELECSTKSALVIQEEQIDNHGLSITEADNQLEDEESINKENNENQEAKGVQPNEVIQSITKEALDGNIQPPYEEKFVDANADSQQNDESSTTQILNTEVQKNAIAYEESGNEEIQGKETHEESGHEESHGNETPTDEEIVDQRLEEIEFGNVTSNEESTEVPPHQDECTVISDDGNQATDVQEEVASGKLQENIEDEDTNKMTENVSTEQNLGPAEAVENPECFTTSDPLTESTITSDEAEKYVTGEKRTVVENPDVKSPKNLLEEGHTEDEDFVTNEGVSNQSSEPVDADEKFDLKQEATEGQDLEETSNMRQEAIKEDVQRETVGEIWNDKGGEVACEPGESNETREIDLVQDDEKVNNATNEETIASYPSEDENANISNDEIQVIGFQEEAKIEEQRGNIVDENSNNILEDVSREENVKPAEDDIYAETEDVRSEEGFQLVTNDEEKITDGNTESPQQPRESNATELDNTELQREENVDEQSESNDIHRTDKVFHEETMESNEEQNQELIEVSTLNFEDENRIASLCESNNSKEETQTEIQEEGTVEAQLDSQQDESPIKSGDGASKEKKLDKPESGSESMELSEENKIEEEKTNMEVNDLEDSSVRNTTESRSTEATSLITKEREIGLAECTLEKEEDAAKIAEVCQINIQTQDIDKRESTEEDVQQPILEKRKDCEVKPVDSKTDNSHLENEKDIYMSDEQYKSFEMDGSDLDKEKEIMNEGLQAAVSSNKVQKEHSTTAAEASEQNAGVEKDTLSQDVSLYISNDQSQVVEVHETEVTDIECQPHESEDLESIHNISPAQVEEVKDDLKEEQDIPKETIEKEEKQGADSGEVKFSITNMSNVEEETDLGKDHPEGNIVNTLDVFSPKEIQQVDNDGVEDILPEIEQLENPVREEMAENGSSQTNEQELEMKNGHTSKTEDNNNIMVVQVPKKEMTKENSLEKETRDTQDELVLNSEFEPTKDSKLKEELVEEAGNINESSFSSEQSESSEQALKHHGQESIPIQAEETDDEMVKNELNDELMLEEKQCEMNVEAQDATICNTKLEEVKYMVEPSSTHKTETANTEVNDSLHEGIKESIAEETPAEQASVKESEKAENVEEENLKEEDEKQMVACYDNMPSSENITLVKDETVSQQSHQQGNIKETLGVRSTVETEQVDDRKQFFPEAEEVISTPQLEHESRDVALVENNANQPTEKLHVVHTDREVMLPDCQDVEEVSAADIIAIQIARAIEEEEQLQQQSSEQQKERHEATELVSDMDDNTLENQVPNEESENSNSLEDKTEDTYLPEERGIEIEIQKDMHSKQEMVEKVDDSEMSVTEDLPSASPGTGSLSEGETNKVSGSSMDSSSQEILNEQEIKDSNKSQESNSSPQVNTINNLIPEENSANSCTTDDNERTASLAKEPEIPTEERTISEELDKDKHQKTISSKFMEDGKTVLTSDVNQAASCDAATEQVAELKVVQETSQGFPHEDTKAQSQHKDPLASVRSVEDDEKPAIIAKTAEVLDEKVRHSQKTMESPDEVEKTITEVEEERRAEFSDTLGSGKKEAVAHGKVSPILDIPKTQVTVVVPGTPEATEERKTIILTDDFDSPTEQTKLQNAITAKENIILENQEVQDPRGLEEGGVRVEDVKNEEIQQTRNMNELENTKIVETKSRSMDSSVITALTSQADGHKTEKVEQVIPKEEKNNEKEVVVEEAKTDEEKDESVDQSQEDLEQREMPITAEALGEMEFKATHKKSHNILFGVGSKVKHSISKMKKAIACSSGQFSQEDVIIKVNKNKKA